MFYFQESIGIKYLKTFYIRLNKLTKQHGKINVKTKLEEIDMILAIFYFPAKNKENNFRCGQDSNLRGNCPLDFKSNALTTRPPQPLHYFHSLKIIISKLMNYQQPIFLIVNECDCSNNFISNFSQLLKVSDFN